MTSPEKCKVLIVDDEEVLRETIAFDFEARGYEVFQASGGEEAIQLIKDNPVQLILSDIRMPNGGGKLILDKMKENDPLAPRVILVSGFSDSNFYEIYNWGADALFSKPYDRDELFKSITKLLTPATIAWKQIEDIADIGNILQQKNLQWESSDFKMGRGGFFLHLKDNFPTPNQQVHFELDFVNGPVEKMRGRGIVRWSRIKVKSELPPGIGIEIIDLDDKSLGKVASFIHEKKPIPFIPQ